MGKGSNTSTSTTTSSADPQAEAAYRDLLTRAQNVASTPYQAYTGDLTAGVNSQQQAGIAGINANAGYASPYITQAANQATMSSAPITAQTIQGYQNPYTQQVVDATTAQMRNDFGQQQAALTGNQIAQGALGGNATGVARGILAGQQGRTMASTVSDLYNKSYQQALSAAQQQQQTGLAGANAIANYGLQGQNAALQGAGAQIGAGTLQQTTDQANLDRLYQQYQQAQAFPYQQAQWLAGMQTGVGSNLGGSSSGTTTGPAPNSTGQWLGAALTGASLFLSDENAKEDIEHIGHLKDGQKLYRFRYKGRPETHIGLLAGEVEEKHPEHVTRGLGGLRLIDLEGATDEAAIRRASGGGVGAVPWGGAPSWIPQMNIHAGSGAPQGRAPSLPEQKSGLDANKAAQQIVGIGKGLGGLDWGGGYDAGLGNLSGDSWGGGSFLGGGAFGGSSASPLPGLDASDYGIGFASGGVVSDGGFNDLDARAPVIEDGGYNAMDAAAPVISDGGFNELDALGGMPDDIRALGLEKIRRGEGIRAPDAIPGGEPEPGVAPDTSGLPVFDENGRLLGNQTSAQGQVPNSAPVVAEPEEPVTPPSDSSARSRGLAGARVMAFDGQSPYGEMPDAVSRPRPRESGLGLGLISPNAQTGLLAAGLGMLASRSPFLGNVVGEGGLAGLSSYGAAEERDRQAAVEAEKLAREIREKQAKFGLDVRKQDETERHNRASEAKERSGADRLPPGLRMGPQGKAEVIPGVEEGLGKISAARRPPPGEALDEEDARFLASRVAAGDTKALVGLGRGAQGAQNLLKINRELRLMMERGEDVSPAARQILQNAAQQQGLIAAERTQAQIMAKLSVYGRTAFNATDIAEKLSSEVPRTSFQPINKVFNAARTNTGDPKIVALGQALMTLTNEYARAIGGGHGTVHDKEAAERRLSMAQSHEQLKAVMDVMRQEIVAEERAMPAAREHMRSIYNPRPGQVGHSIAGEHGMAAPNGPVPGASGFKPPPGAIPRTYQGKTYYYDPNTKQPYPGQ